MSVEQELKGFIVARYGTVKDFAISIDMPSADAGGAAVGSGVGSAVAAGAAVAVGASAVLGEAEDAAEPQADRETAQASARAMRVLFCKIFIKILLAK